MAGLPAFVPEPELLPVLLPAVVPVLLPAVVPALLPSVVWFPAISLGSLLLPPLVQAVAAHIKVISIPAIIIFLPLNRFFIITPPE